MEQLVPKDHGEAVAVFRSQLIGPLVHRQLTRGELHAEFVALAKLRVMPPGSKLTRTYSEPTLERWYYRFRKRGLAGLVPRPRKDRGHAQALSPETRELLLAVRRQNPSASAKLIVRTLEASGRLTTGKVSGSTVRRLFAAAGLLRRTLREAQKGEGADRRRWEAAHAGALWHGDVCYGPMLGGEGRWTPTRIHGLLDDKSRYVVALEVLPTEREIDMLSVFLRALRRHGRPGALYFDNGSTYSGAALATACARLGTALVHAKPYDPEARGKMERFWRTLREKCLDHVSRELSRAELQLRLDRFLSDHYQREPHEGLLGETPESAWAEHQTHTVSEEQLASALTVEKIRMVTKDGVISIGGVLFEVRQSFLAGRRVTVRSCLVAGLPTLAEALHDGRRFALKPLDRAANGKTRRDPRTAPPPRTIDFDPTAQ
jgi:transposase InsO family protein